MKRLLKHLLRKYLTIKIPLIYAPKGSTIILDYNKYTITYKGKTGATLMRPFSSHPMPTCYRKFAIKALVRPDEPNPFIYCDLIKAPDSFSIEEFISLHPEYFI